MIFSDKHVRNNLPSKRVAKIRTFLDNEISIWIYRITIKYQNVIYFPNSYLKVLGLLCSRYELLMLFSKFSLWPLINFAPKPFSKKIEHRVSCTRNHNAFTYNTVLTIINQSNQAIPTESKNIIVQKPKVFKQDFAVSVYVYEQLSKVRDIKIFMKNLASIKYVRANIEKLAVSMARQT